jgi:hypothetical protein
MIRTIEQMQVIQTELDAYPEDDLIHDIIDELHPDTATYLREWGITAVTVRDRLANVEDDLN